METNRYFTLTSKAGRFIFPRTVILSHAKLIRDTVTARVMGWPPMHVPYPRPENVVKWIKEHLEGPVGKAGYLFEWVPAEGNRINFIAQLPDGKYVVS